MIVDFLSFLSFHEEIVALGILVVGYFFYYWFRRPSHFPPGPRGLPVLGVAPFLGKFPERTFRKWSKSYGPIMSARLGSNDIVVLNSSDVIQQVSRR